MPFVFCSFSSPPNPPKHRRLETKSWGFVQTRTFSLPVFLCRWCRKSPQGLLGVSRIVLSLRDARRVSQLLSIALDLVTCPKKQTSGSDGKKNVYTSPEQ